MTEKCGVKLMISYSIIIINNSFEFIIGRGHPQREIQVKTSVARIIDRQPVLAECL